jgi:hypothetical protein
MWDVRPDPFFLFLVRNQTAGKRLQLKYKLRRSVLSGKCLSPSICVPVNFNDGEHLKAFAVYLKAKIPVKPLQDLDWVKFAEGYNGPDYREN